MEANEIFIVSKVANRSFTRQEWWDYCDNERKNPDYWTPNYHPYEVIDNGFKWNVLDSCINPHEWKVFSFGLNNYSLTTRTASYQGRWYAGLDYRWPDGGFGSGAWINEESFSTEEEAQKAMIEKALIISKEWPKEIKQIARKALNKFLEPKQLSLF